MIIAALLAGFVVGVISANYLIPWFLKGYQAYKHSRIRRAAQALLDTKAAAEKAIADAQAVLAADPASPTK